jgi:hypothetical protein
MRMPNAKEDFKDFVDTDPGYYITEGEKLRVKGYDPVPIKPGFKYPPDKAWQKKDYSKAKAKYKGYGVGIRTAKTPAVDIDVYDPEVVKMMVEFTKDLLGDSVERVGQPPKVAMIYRAELPFKKVTSSWFIDGDGNDCRIEILGDGQQIVAHHIHPDTNLPYTWNGDLPAVDQLPVITLEHARAICEHFDHLAETVLGWELKTKGSKGGNGIDQDNPFIDLPTKTDVTRPEMVALLEQLDPGLHNDDWIRVLMAVQSTGEPWAKEVAKEWSAGSSKYDMEGACITDRCTQRTGCQWSDTRYPGKLLTGSVASMPGINLLLQFLHLMVQFS